MAQRSCGTVVRRLGTHHGCCTPSSIIPSRISSRCYATIRASRGKPGFDAWGKVDVSAITEKSLREEKEARPSSLRYEPHEYVDALREFSATSERSSADWPFHLNKDARPPKELLNDLGCYTSSLATGTSNAPLKGPVAQAMFSGASMLGCEASCVSLVQSLIHGDRGILQRPLIKPNYMRFRNIVSRGQNPYALTTEASLLLLQKSPRAAAAAAEKACRIARESNEGFPWMGRSRFILGQASHALRDETTALDHFRSAAEDGYRDAWQWIGRLSPDPAERRRALFKGGVSGDAAAFNILSDEFANFGEQVSGEDSEEHLKWASEFKRMASALARR